MKLEGKVAVVTGAGWGIGRAIALTLAKEGANILVNDIDIGLASKVAEEVKSIGRRALAIKADVSKSEDVIEMSQKTIETFGQIDILVNNAGIVRVVPIAELTEALWDRIIDTNLKGVFLCCQTVGNHMIKQKRGKIINIASVAGHFSRPGIGAYSASKGGVLQLTRALGVEWADYNINVNSVSPGVTETLQLTEISKADPTVLMTRLKRIPQRRINKPEDIANAVLFLASAEADNITGQDIRVDGGVSALHPGYGWPER